MLRNESVWKWIIGHTLSFWDGMHVTLVRLFPLRQTDWMDLVGFQLLKLWENHGYLNKETLEVRLTYLLRPERFLSVWVLRASGPLVQALLPATVFGSTSVECHSEPLKCTHNSPLSFPLAQTDSPVLCVDCDLCVCVCVSACVRAHLHSLLQGLCIYIHYYIVCWSLCGMWLVYCSH